jgi:hypothetical protein
VHTGFWWGKFRVRTHLEDLGIDGRIILKSSLRNEFGLRSDSCGLGRGHVSGFCERGNGPSVSIKYK